ncbi:TlpA family protein disulfide reductase [Thioalkalivibrio sp.]|uniref:TlpA family protein disulfide reductase n=1 Tax=Thioalkalivibrio sp. TaxID=2093813 RepID=UPI003975FD4E
MLGQRILLLLPALLLVACGGERPTIANGEPAPGFELERLDGGRTSLDELAGTVIALRFWADWCPFCRPEMRALEPVYQRLHGRGLELLAVNVGQDRARVERFVEGLDYGYPTLLDSDSAVARRYGVIAIPVTYFIDRDGIVRGRILGESDAATFEAMALALLQPHDAHLRTTPGGRHGDRLVPVDTLVGEAGGLSAGRREHLPVGLTAASLPPPPADRPPAPPLPPRVLQ